MREEILTYGSRLVEEDGLFVSLHDRNGNCWLDLEWSERRLRHATLRLPNGATVNVRPEARQHPVLGLCDSVVVDGRQRTFFTSVDWADPGSVPAMDAPGKLPPGAGSAIMNLLAYLSGKSLRYRGPYPTAALFDTLRSAFRSDGNPREDLALFTADVETLALSGELAQNSVLFHPAPCEMLSTGDLTVVLRHGVERIICNGHTYSSSALGTRKIRSEGSSIVAYVEIGGEPWVDIARCGLDGEHQDGPHAVPSFDHVLNGEPVPEAMVSLVKAVVTEGAPDLLKPKIAEAADSLEWCIDDAGGENVTVKKGRVYVHSLLVERLAARSPERFLRHIVEGARPHLLRRAQATLLKDVEQLRS